MSLVTKELLHQLFDYKDNCLVWKINRGSNQMTGKKAGSQLKNGYWHIRINKKAIYTHRAVFLYHYGFLPETIDHIDGNPSNNAVENLREATQSQNNRNRKRKLNKYGQHGITLLKGKYWMPKLQVDKKLIYVGVYKNLDDAKTAYENAVKKYCGDFRSRA
jgi:inorganic pyrophosphatase